MRRPINERVLELAPYQPGKPPEVLERELGIPNAIKLASNENPRGPGPQVLEAIANASRMLSRYPDGSGFHLKNTLAEHLGVDSSWITLGNGSNDVLELAARIAISPGEKGVVDQHCFVVYPQAINAAHGHCVRVPSANWGHDLDSMADSIDDHTRIVYIANPNNPTGTWISADAIENFLGQIPSSVWVVLDEAYFEYVQESEYPDGVKLCQRYDNLIITRTFSKIHGLASLRVGYSVSNPDVADLMNRIRQPFNVNSVALAAAQAALHSEDFMRESIQLNATGMEFVRKCLSDLKLDVISTAGNFLTFECPDATETYQKMLLKGVIVRPVANYSMPNHLRVTIGTADENARFIETLSSSL